jgi:hypothetical protein
MCEREPAKAFRDLAETPTVEIRTKRDPCAPMHLKSYQIDGRVRRTGAANFSGLRGCSSVLLRHDLPLASPCRLAPSSKCWAAPELKNWRLRMAACEVQSRRVPFLRRYDRGSAHRAGCALPELRHARRHGL